MISAVDQMKFVKMEVLIDKGDFSRNDEWKTIYDQIQQAIAAIEWPPGSGSFTIHKQSGKKRGEGSGVKPIKDACMTKLQQFGWDLENTLDIAFMINVYHHLDKPVTLVKNVIPSLRANGILAIVDAEPEKSGFGEDHSTPENEMLDQLDEAGYEVIRVETFLQDDNIYICRPKSD